MHAVGTIGHRAARGREPATALGQEPHHAVGRREPEGRAAGQHDRVDLGDGAVGVEQRDLAGRGRAAADLAGADRALRAGARR